MDLGKRGLTSDFPGGDGQNHARQIRRKLKLAAARRFARMAR